MTINYTCKRCGYTTNNRTIYANHLKKKKVKCKPVLSNIDTDILIDELDRYISENSRMGIYAPDNIIVKNEESLDFTDLLKMINVKEKEIEDLQKENSLLRSSTENINSHNTNHITNDIELSIYGNEDFTYIVHELLNTIQTNPFERIPRLVGLIHMNPDDPDSHHVRWVDVDKDEILYDLNEGMLYSDKEYDNMV